MVMEVGAWALCLHLPCRQPLGLPGAYEQEGMSTTHLAFTTSTCVCEQALRRWGSGKALPKHQASITPPLICEWLRRQPARALLTSANLKPRSYRKGSPRSVRGGDLCDTGKLASVNEETTCNLTVPRRGDQAGCPIRVYLKNPVSLGLK